MVLVVERKRPWLSTFEKLKDINNDKFIRAKMKIKFINELIDVEKKKEMEIEGEEKK